MNDKTLKEAVKISEIKQAVAKIDLDKINGYLQEYPKSHTLKEIIKFSRKLLASEEEKWVFRWGVKLAYNLDTICDPDKAGYVKDEKEKKSWLEISEELFKHTIGVKK